MIHIDGSLGEGGGQILRTSLSLSLVTGKSFAITNIRSGRKKPGLLRQHLTAVNAAKEISNASVKGNTINSREFTFQPEDVLPGKYYFRIGTAGSATLVLQTILPALIFGKAPSTIVLEGGTHNPFAPPFDFLKHCFLPCLKRMGVHTSTKLLQYGFYPVGGGKFIIDIEPVKRLKPINILEKGKEKNIEVIGFVSKIPLRIAGEEVKMILSKMQWDNSKGSAREVRSAGPGNIVFVKLEYENIFEVFTGFGQRGIPLKKVAESVVRQVKKYISSGTPVGEYLSDQLLIPFVLAGKGKYRTHVLTNHTRTNIGIIKKFLNFTIMCNTIADDCWEIEVKGEQNKVGKK